MKKKSFKKSAEWFKIQLHEVQSYTQDIDRVTKLSPKSIRWCYSFAVIQVYKAFEEFMLNCLIAAINNDHGPLEERTGVSFPKSLSVSVCEYLIVGDSYFNLKGRDDLTRNIRRYVKKDHFLLKVIQNSSYKKTLDQLFALRNFAAHESNTAKEKVRKVIEQRRIESSGQWLMIENRLGRIIKKLSNLADEIHRTAP